MSDEKDTRPPRSLFALITELPHLLAELIRAELEMLRRELVHRLKGTGAGIGLLIVALNLLVVFLLLLVLAGVFALALVMPYWAAALVVAGGVLLLTLALGAMGAKLVAGSKPIPRRTIANVREDIRRIRGQRRSGSRRSNSGFGA